MSGESFPDWLKRLDQLFVNQFGLPHDHFPDWGWWDAWEAGSSPAEALEEYADSGYL